MQPTSTHDHETLYHQSKNFLLDHADLHLKQWQFSVTWQPTATKKIGFLQGLSQQKQMVDLDISCLLFDQQSKLIEKIWFKNMRDEAESICHHGDDLGKKRPNHENQNLSQAQESMDIFFHKIPETVHHIAFVLSSYHGQFLYKNKSAQCNINDDEGEPILQLPLAKIEKSCRAIWLATLNKKMDQWQFITNYQSLSDYRLQNFSQEIEQEMCQYQFI